MNLPKPSEFGVALQDVALDVKAGEIFGVAGVAGNGQNELMSAMSGETRAPTPKRSRWWRRMSAARRDRAARPWAYAPVPEERNGHAAVSEFSLTDNRGAHRSRPHGDGELRPHRSKQGDHYAAEVIGAYTVKATGPGALAGSLSGGNLQKFIMGREILQRPEALVVCQPTGGWTRARRPPSIRRSSISPRAARRSWSSRRT